MFQYRMKDMLDVGVYTQAILGDDSELAAMASAPFASSLEPLPPSGAEAEEVEIINETPPSPSPSLLAMIPRPPPAIPLTRRGPPPQSTSGSSDPFENDGGALMTIGEALLPIEVNWKPQGRDL